jgi:phospholipid/cholesterol/gamma-HCH transport system substrate-binding protein
VLPVENTMPDVNPDEVLAALDGDTRDYLKLLVSGAGQGLKGRGDELAEVFRRFEPTHRDLARVTSKVAERRQNLRRLVNSLNRLNSALAAKDDDLAQLVDTSARTFRAFASQDTNITAAVEELPSALRETTQTLGKVETFANILRPSLNRLSPAVRRIDEANRALRPLALEATPKIRDEVRPFVRESRPLVRSLRPAARSLADSTPDLTRTFVVLNNLFNMLGFNEGGRQGPDVASRQEGYLFWLAWLGHNGGAVFSTADATGIFRPVAIQATCSTLKQTVNEEPELEFLQGLTGALFDPRVCASG